MAWSVTVTLVFLGLAMYFAYRTKSTEKAVINLSTLTPTINKTYRRRWLSAVGATAANQSCVRLSKQSPLLLESGRIG